jgi:hypothetical protein
MRSAIFCFLFAIGSQHKLTMCLDTVPARREAQSLYEPMGFQDVEAYRANPVHGTILMELIL